MRGGLGRRRHRKGMYIYSLLTDSCCCTAETNTTCKATILQLKKIIFKKAKQTKGHTYSLVAQTVKNRPATWEILVPPLDLEDPLEKGLATHSSILAQRIPWTEEAGGLQSMGSHRVGGCEGLKRGLTVPGETGPSFPFIPCWGQIWL